MRRCEKETSADNSSKIGEFTILRSSQQMQQEQKLHTVHGCSRDRAGGEERAPRPRSFARIQSLPVRSSRFNRPPPIKLSPASTLRKSASFDSYKSEQTQKTLINYFHLRPGGRRRVGNRPAALRQRISIQSGRREDGRMAFYFVFPVCTSEPGPSLSSAARMAPSRGRADEGVRVFNQSMRFHLFHREKYGNAPPVSKDCRPRISQPGLGEAAPCPKF